MATSTQASEDGGRNCPSRSCTQARAPLGGLPARQKIGARRLNRWRRNEQRVHWTAIKQEAHRPIRLHTAERSVQDPRTLRERDHGERRQPSNKPEPLSRRLRQAGRRSTHTHGGVDEEGGVFSGIPSTHVLRQHIKQIHRARPGGQGYRVGIQRNCVSFKSIRRGEQFVRRRRRPYATVPEGKATDIALRTCLNMPNSAKCRFGKMGVRRIMGRRVSGLHRQRRTTEE